MIVSMLAAFAVMFALMAGWIGVQRAARRVAQEHPECGPFRLVGGGCGGHGSEPVEAEACAGCSNTSCKAS